MQTAPELTLKTDGQEEVKVKPTKSGNRYYLGVTNGSRLDLWITPCLFTDTWNTVYGILGALKDIIFHFFSLNKLGGPVVHNASLQAVN